MEQGMNEYYCSHQPGEIIEGHYRILHPIKMKAMVRDLQNGWREEKSFPLRSTPHPVPQESHYCQIVQINEKNGIISATLLLGDGDHGSWRKFPLSCEEDIQLIKDGLEKNDHEVFCTLVKILGKEVLGDIKCLPKDPPILKLPAEVFDMICNRLENEDLLSLRLTCSTLAHDFLPMDKSWPISTLRIDADGMYTFMVNKKNRGGIYNEWGTCDKYTPPRRKMLNKKGYFDVIPQPLTDANINVKWLNTTKKLHLGLSLLVHCPDYWEIIINNCINLETLELSGYRKDNAEVQLVLQDEQKMRNIFSQVLSRNETALKKFKVWLTLRQGSFDPIVLTPCKNLKEIDIFLGSRGTFVNLSALEAFKGTLTSLNITGIKNPLRKDDLLWIARNLINLGSLKVQVVHSCELNHVKEGEIDEHVLLLVVENLLKLKTVEVVFGPCSSNNEEETFDEYGRPTRAACPKCDRIMKGFKGLYKNQRGIWNCEYAEQNWPISEGSMIRCVKSKPE